MHAGVEKELKKRWEANKANHGSVHVAEYAEADWEQGRITGDPSKVWIWNGSGLEEASADTKQSRKTKAGGVFEQAGMRYCFHPDDGTVLVEFVTGVLSGSGMIMKISGEGDALLPDPNGPRWGA